MDKHTPAPREATMTDAPKITKRKEGVGWRILKNGQPTGLTIERGPAPQYRDGQTWEVIVDDAFLFDARSLGAALAIIARIAEALA